MNAWLCNPRDAIGRHCNADGVVKHDVIDSMGRTQRAKFITEGNLYRLITHSKLTAAERFEKWVFDEVLPSIRQTGGYGSQPTGLTKLAEQIAQAATAMAQAATAMVTVVDKLTGLVDRMSSPPSNLLRPRPVQAGELPQRTCASGGRDAGTDAGAAEPQFQHDRPVLHRQRPYHFQSGGQDLLSEVF